MGLRFEEINPPKKEEAPAKKPAARKTKSTKVEESTDSN
jgi:hypothetical protein